MVHYTGSNSRCVFRIFFSLKTAEISSTTDGQIQINEGGGDIISESDGPICTVPVTTDPGESGLDPDNIIVKYLYDIEPVSGEFLIDTMSTEDALNNQYQTHYVLYLSEFQDSEKSATFPVKDYSIFKGILFTEAKAPDKSAFRLEVMSDGEKVYTSSTITKFSEPENIELNLAGANFMELKFYFEDGSGGMADGWYRQATANLAEARLIRE